MALGRPPPCKCSSRARSGTGQTPLLRRGCWSWCACCSMAPFACVCVHLVHRALSSALCYWRRWTLALRQLQSGRRLRGGRIQVRTHMQAWPAGCVPRGLPLPCTLLAGRTSSSQAHTAGWALQCPTCAPRQQLAVPAGQLLLGATSSLGSSKHSDRSTLPPETSTGAGPAQGMLLAVLKHMHALQVTARCVTQVSWLVSVYS